MLRAGLHVAMLHGSAWCLFHFTAGPDATRQVLCATCHDAVAMMLRVACYMLRAVGDVSVTCCILQCYMMLDVNCCVLKVTCSVMLPYCCMLHANNTLLHPHLWLCSLCTPWSHSPSQPEGEMVIPWGKDGRILLNWG